MPEATCKVVWEIKLTGAELTLILRALDGRLEESHVAPASKLYEELLKMRIGSQRCLIDGFEKLEKNVAAAKQEE